jgi:hypothetical protein
MYKYSHELVILQNKKTNDNLLEGRVEKEIEMSNKYNNYISSHFYSICNVTIKKMIIVHINNERI